MATARPMTADKRGYRDYGWKHAEGTCASPYLLPAMLSLSPDLGRNLRILDVGCGNGYMAGVFLGKGCDVTGIDLSEQGIEIARRTHPRGRFEVLPADENLLANLGCDPFDLVISTEVVEHLYDPRSFVRGCYHALRPGGRFILSTPYHGYLKNLALSLAGKWDVHANPLWDGGHIKLWSRRTLSQLLTEAGFGNLQFRGAGRWPWLWKSMVVSGDR